MASAATVVSSRMLDFVLDFGGIPNDESACEHNTRLLSQVLQLNASSSNTASALRLRIVAPNQTLYVYPGVHASFVQNAVLIIDGTLRFERRTNHDASTNSNNSNETMNGRHPTPCFMLDGGRNITMTSSSVTSRGVMDGRGSMYWGIPAVGFLQVAEHRPRLLQINGTTQLHIHHLVFRDSPYHTIYLEGVRDVVVHHVSIVARRTAAPGHGLLDLTAFNTDGIDVSGTNVHIHDVDIWVQDDCIAIKDNVLYEPYESTNMVLERINCSGLGLVIGSIGGTHVKNITFRDSYLHHSVKGIYLKFRHPGAFELEHGLSGLIENILFDNITMEQPSQWPIWIGPAQQSDERRPCAARPCSLCWPHNPWAKCRAVAGSLYRNVTLRNVRIHNPVMSPGVLLGGGGDRTDAWIHGLWFDNVTVTQGLPLAQALINRTINFPGLLQPIDDYYVPSTRNVQLIQGMIDARVPDVRWEGMFPDEPMQIENASNNGPSDLLVAACIVMVCWHLLLLAMFRSRLLRGRSRGYRPIPSRTSMSNTEDADGLDDRATYDVSESDGVCRIEDTPSSTGVSLPVAMSMTIVELLFLLTFYNVLVTQTHAGKPEWNRLDQYFRCEGIVDGLATGGTWPVPSCFNNTIDD